MRDDEKYVKKYYEKRLKELEKNVQNLFGVAKSYLENLSKFENEVIFEGKFLETSGWEGTLKLKRDLSGYKNFSHYEWRIEITFFLPPSVSFLLLYSDWDFEDKKKYFFLQSVKNHPFDEVKDFVKSLTISGKYDYLLSSAQCNFTLFDPSTFIVYFFLPLREKILEELYGRKMSCDQMLYDHLFIIENFLFRFRIKLEDLFKLTRKRLNELNEEKKLYSRKKELKEILKEVSIEVKKLKKFLEELKKNYESEVVKLKVGDEIARKVTLEILDYLRDEKFRENFGKFVESLRERLENLIFESRLQKEFKELEFFER